MVSPTVIRNKIIEILKAAPTLTHIKKWFIAEPPPSRYPDVSWGWVEWPYGPQAPANAVPQMRIEDYFYIVVVNKHIDAEKAEDSVMDSVEAVESVLDDNLTLDNLVSASWVVNREKEKRFLGDYSLVAARLTLYTRRIE